MRVLVVDDEKRLARSLQVGLEAEGFAVDLAHDGTDGLWLARGCNASSSSCCCSPRTDEGAVARTVRDVDLDDPGEAYEVEVRKADNTEWNVELDADFKVLRQAVDN